MIPSSVWARRTDPFIRALVAVEPRPGCCLFRSRHVPMLSCARAVAGLRGSLRVLSSLGRFLPCLCVTVCVGLDLRVPCCSSEFRKAGLICAHASVAKGTLRSGVCGLVGWLRVLCAGGLPGCAQAPGWPGAFWAPSRFGAYLRLWRHVQI